MSDVEDPKHHVSVHPASLDAAPLLTSRSDVNEQACDSSVSLLVRPKLLMIPGRIEEQRQQERGRNGRLRASKASHGIVANSHPFSGFSWAHVRAVAGWSKMGLWCR